MRSERTMKRISAILLAGSPSFPSTTGVRLARTSILPTELRKTSLPSYRGIRTCLSLLATPLLLIAARWHGLPMWHAGLAFVTCSKEAYGAQETEFGLARN